MAFQLDTSVYDKQKTIMDYMRQADQDNLTKRSSESAIESNELKNHAAKAETAVKYLSMATPENWQSVRQAAIQEGLGNESMIPAQYDPNWINKSLSAWTQTKNTIPAAIQEYDFYNKLGSQEDKDNYLKVKRANPLVNQGDVYGVRNQATNEITPAPGGRINPKPDNMPGFKGDQVTAEKTAAENVSRRSNLTKAQSALTSFKQQSKLVTDNIDKALAVIDKPYSASTGYGQVLSGLPNTDSRELNNYIKTIQSNIGFDKLQNMRDNSPTGGALGNVSDNENRLLAATQGALDPGQKEQLKSNLKVIKDLYPVVLAEKERAFNQDYGGYQPIGDNPQKLNLSTKITPHIDDMEQGSIPMPQKENIYKSKYGLE